MAEPGRWPRREPTALDQRAGRACPRRRPKAGRRTPVLDAARRVCRSTGVDRGADARSAPRVRAGVHPPGPAGRRRRARRSSRGSTRCYPSPSDAVNRELCQLLVYLESPTVVAKTMKLLGEAPTQEEQLHYVADPPRRRSTGWTPELRAGVLLLAQPRAAEVTRGGHSFKQFLDRRPRGRGRDAEPGREDGAGAVPQGQRNDGDAVREAAAAVRPQLADGGPRPDPRPGRHAAAPSRAARPRSRRRSAPSATASTARAARTGPDITGVGNRFTPATCWRRSSCRRRSSRDQYQNDRVIDERRRDRRPHRARRAGR